MTTIIIIIAILALWTLYGYFSSKVEQAEYKVIKKTSDYEIREYSPHIIAEVILDGDYNESMSKGFSIIAKYIFGDNKEKADISMTAPVMVKNNPNNKEIKENSVSFVMPKSYNINNLPKPEDSRIKIIAVSDKKYLVKNFLGYRSENKIKKEQNNLSLFAKENNLKIGEDFIYAGYNPPWTPP
ncbi:MAG: heme-binding protein [Cyanobium sp. MAG06]|nr:heme-binding protein [Cyanobium sp. MAG06]